MSATTMNRTRTGRHLLASMPPTALMLVAASYFLLPMWWLLVAATKTKGDLTTTPSLWFSDLHLGQNIADLLARDNHLYVRWLLNSVLYAGGGAALATVIAAMGGYALAKYDFSGRQAVFNTILASVLVPGTALTLPVFLMMSQIHLTNTYWAVLLPSIVSPFGVYLSRIYASASVPDELLEAARLDGVGEFRIFFTISMRLMKPALITVFLFQFTGIWNNFFLPLIMLSDQNLYPVTLGLTLWNSQTLYDPTLHTAVITGSLLSVVPLVAAFLLLQRYWRSGLAVGSVKS